MPRWFFWDWKVDFGKMALYAKIAWEYTLKTGMLVEDGDSISKCLRSFPSWDKIWRVIQWGLLFLTQEALRLLINFKFLRVYIATSWAYFMIPSHRLFSTVCSINFTLIPPVSLKKLILSCSYTCKLYSLLRNSMPRDLPDSSQILSSPPICAKLYSYFPISLLVSRCWICASLLAPILSG